jgi:hypothetical protein
MAAFGIRSQFSKPPSLLQPKSPWIFSQDQLTALSGWALKVLSLESNAPHLKATAVIEKPTANT